MQSTLDHVYNHVNIVYQANYYSDPNSVPMHHTPFTIYERRCENFVRCEPTTFSSKCQ